jgi:hypothetical protein
MTFAKLVVLSLIPPPSSNENEVVVPDLGSLIKFTFHPEGCFSAGAKETHQVTVDLSKNLCGHALQLIGKAVEFRIVEYNGCKYLIAIKP